jgi:hypothetical protein
VIWIWNDFILKAEKKILLLSFYFPNYLLFLFLFPSIYKCLLKS